MSKRMTKEEINACEDVWVLQGRWNELRNDKRTWKYNKSNQYKEFLMIGTRLCLLRNEFGEAVEYAETLEKIYGESLR